MIPPFFSLPLATSGSVVWRSNVDAPLLNKRILCAVLGSRRFMRMVRAGWLATKLHVLTFECRIAKLLELASGLERNLFREPFDKIVIVAGERLFGAPSALLPMLQSPGQP